MYVYPYGDYYHYPYPWGTPNDNVCPHCGYCPHCNRRRNSQPDLTWKDTIPYTQAVGTYYTPSLNIVGYCGASTDGNS